MVLKNRIYKVIYDLSSLHVYITEHLDHNLVIMPERRFVEGKEYIAYHLLYDVEFKKE